MVKRIVYIAVVLIIVCVVYFAWTRRSVDVAMDEGSVTSHDTVSTDVDRMNRGAVDLDGNPMDGGTSGSTGGSGSRIATSSTAASTGSTGSTALRPAPNTRPQTSLPDVGTTASLPASDSLPENQPENVRFGGTGKFQWYRQGNLTWRINTQSGTTCIAFATMDEWRKSIVSSHGCGNA